MSSRLFARVELRGEPTEEANNLLKKYMENNSWRPYLKYWYESASETHPLQASHPSTVSTNDFNFTEFADALKAEIEAVIWPSAQVWIVQSAGWTKQGE